MPRYSDELIEEVRSRNDIVDFPVEYFRIFYYYFRVHMIVFLMFLGCPVFGAVAMRVPS